MLENVRPLGDAAAGGYECWIRLPDGSLDETAVSAAEARDLLHADTSAHLRLIELLDEEVSAPGGVCSEKIS